MEETTVDFGPSANDIGGDIKTISDIEIEPRLVIAIDFGTYACGFALQWRSDYETNCLESIKIPTKWAGTGFCTRKLPTCLLLKPDKSLHAFGYKADFLFSKYESPKKRPKDWKDWYFFRFFKMRLYSGEELTVDTPLEAANEKFLPVAEVLAASIRFLKDEAIKMLKESGAVCPEVEVKWVITVPAIWNDPAKHVMHEAAERAGIASKNLSIALEPECAAIYCAKLPLDKLEVPSGENDSVSVGAPGQIITVIDMGGGTIDITTVEIQEDRSMSQVSKSCGGPWGGTKVNEKFEKYLKEFIGAETMATFVQNHAMDYHDLRMDFESKKRELNDDDEPIPVKLPDSLKQLWEKAEGTDLDDILDNKGENCGVEFDAGRLFVDSAIIKRFFQETVDGILKIIKEQVFNDKNLDGKGISAILLVGGFAESSFVLESLRKGLKDRNVPILRPHCPELAVLNGAVLFGQNEKIVSSRIMRYTYGVGMIMEFKKGTHNEDERFESDGQLMANNVFRKHVTIGQSVQIGDWISGKEYYPDSDTQKSTIVYIYTSKNPDPVHTTDPDCSFIGQVKVYFGDERNLKKKAVRVEFKFGGTELKVRAVSASGNRTNVRYLKVM